MRLLIVEDERAIAEVMMLKLKRVGYECEYAQDGEMGAAMVRNKAMIWFCWISCFRKSMAMN